MRRFLDAAHKARQGQHDPLSVRAKRARAREKSAVGSSPFGGSPYEQQLALLLRLAGVEFLPQMAVLAYNLDFAVSYLPNLYIAVEVRGGPKDPYRRSGRLEDLRNGGYPVLEIFVGKWCRQPEITPTAVNYLVAFRDYLRDKLRANFILLFEPAVFAEHRMILGDGTVLQPGHRWDRRTE